MDILKSFKKIIIKKYDERVRCAKATHTKTATFLLFIHWRILNYM